RVADLAAIAGAQSMRDNYSRLFDLPSSPRHLSRGAYLALVRDAAVQGAARNGGTLAPDDVSFPDSSSFAPAQIHVRVRGDVRLRVARSGARRRVPVRADATAELSAGPGGLSGLASGGGYRGPLAYRQGKPMRPDVALA